MGENSKIEWTHHTFNPWRGCTKVSSGCKHCYAETMSGRNPANLGIWGPKGTRVIAAESYWRQPLAWNKAADAAGERHRVFCASLADVFEGPETMPVEAWPAVEAARLRLFNLIEQTPHLDWLLLTKRPQNILKYVPARWALKETAHYLESVGAIDNSSVFGWPANVWIGTSVEDQTTADERIPHLLRVPARVRFLSCEPLLGPVNLAHFLIDDWTRIGDNVHYHEHPPIHWLIVGGESGTSARPMHPAWVRSLRDQCVDAGVSFFFKQWGEWLGTMPIEPKPHTGQCYEWNGGYTAWKIGKRAAGRLLDGREWNDVPQ